MKLQIIFEGVVGRSYLSDIAVDDIYLSKGTCCRLKQRTFDAGLIGEFSSSSREIFLKKLKSSKGMLM